MGTPSAHVEPASGARLRLKQASAGSVIVIADFLSGIGTGRARSQVVQVRCVDGDPVFDADTAVLLRARLQQEAQGTHAWSATAHGGHPPN